MVYCSLFHGQLRYSRQNHFLQNSLERNNSFHTISPEGVIGGDGVMRYIQRLYMGTMLCDLVFEITAMIIILNFLLLFFVIPTLIPLFPINRIRKIKKNMQKLNPNLFENNQASDLDELGDILSEFKVY